MASNPTHTHTPISPLYTPKDKAKLKQAMLKRLGPDTDGAMRVTNRIDGGVSVSMIEETRVLERV